ncbi:hypothetical protein B0H13DRAFT_1918911 [Mycena leptocephala]|nr:hypothetical protein B0H13DRAFT_1918911 [Mycena leptocephala]
MTVYCPLRIFETRSVRRYLSKIRTVNSYWNDHPCLLQDLGGARREWKASRYKETNHLFCDELGLLVGVGTAKTRVSMDEKMPLPAQNHVIRPWESTPAIVGNGDKHQRTAKGPSLMALARTYFIGLAFLVKGADGKARAVTIHHSNGKRLKAGEECKSWVPRVSGKVSRYYQLSFLPDRIWRRLRLICARTREESEVETPLAGGSPGQITREIKQRKGVSMPLKIKGIVPCRYAGKELRHRKTAYNPNCVLGFLFRT